MTELIQVALLNIKDHDLHRRVYSSEGICPTIRAQSGGNAEPKVLIDGAAEMTENKPTVRKLTEKECLMLQGFTAEEADRLRNAEKNGKRRFPKTALYEFAGNAVCVACFERITEQILADMDEPRKAPRNTLDAWMGSE